MTAASAEIVLEVAKEVHSRLLALKVKPKERLHVYDKGIKNLSQVPGWEIARGLTMDEDGALCRTSATWTKSVGGEIYHQGSRMDAERLGRLALEWTYPPHGYLPRILSEEKVLEAVRAQVTNYLGYGLGRLTPNAR